MEEEFPELTKKLSVDLCSLGGAVILPLPFHTIPHSPLLHRYNSPNGTSLCQNPAWQDPHFG